MKVQLVNPYPVKFFRSNTMDCYPPLGLLSIAAYLGATHPEIEVELLDASVTTQEEVEAAISADVVGISTTIGTYENALRVAKISKNRGARVVLGGAYASVLAKRILLKRPYVDCVIAGDGERAFAQYASGRPAAEIANLVYRSDHGLTANSSKDMEVDELPQIDFGLVHVNDYFANFRKRFTFLGERLDHSRELPVYSRRGCAWRLTRACLFCSIFDRSLRIKSPERVWSEISHLVSLYDIDGVYDVSDDFLSDLEWLARFVELKSRRVYFVVMGRVSPITHLTADLLSQLGCVRIFLGIECGDQAMLDNMGKGTSVLANLDAVRVLAERGIKVTAGVVLGAPGESEDSLRRTVEFFGRLMSFGNLDVIDPSVLIPLPGSRSFEKLLSIPEMRDKYAERDVFDAQELQQDWVRSFCKVAYAEMLQAIDTLRGQVKLSLY